MCVLKYTFSFSSAIQAWSPLSFWTGCQIAFLSHRVARIFMSAWVIHDFAFHDLFIQSLHDIIMGAYEVIRFRLKILSFKVWVWVTLDNNARFEFSESYIMSVYGRPYKFSGFSEHLSFSFWSFLFSAHVLLFCSFTFYPFRFILFLLIK